MKKDYILYALVSLALLALAACAPPATSAPAATSVPGAQQPSAVKPVQLTDGKLVLAVINDQSGVYADLGGKNVVEAVKMAVEDFKAKYGENALGGAIEVISADHQNKADVASSKAQEFYDRNSADLILDVPTSSAALAIAGVAKDKKRMYINVSGASSELTEGTTGQLKGVCNKYTFHYAYDTYMLALGTATYVTKNVGKKWYMVYPNYAFGQDMDRSFRKVIEANGGSIVASDPSPFPNDTGDFSSFLLKVPTLKPDVVGLMNAGVDLQNAIKQYNEFKLKDKGFPLAIGLLFDTDIKSLGSDAIAGVVYTTPWLWAMDDQSRAWADKFQKRVGSRPTFAHAGNYSAAWNYMEAVRAARTDDADAIVKQLEGSKINDFFIRNGTVRAKDHLVIHDVLQAQVKPASEVKEPGDYSKILGIVPAAQAFRPEADSTCAMGG
ncbi:MAG: ABC transporter substrate-binding protein [Chloroflexota bacterium]